MNSNTVIIEEKGQSKKSSKLTIMKVIDNQIKECKLNFLSSWERDHSTTQDTTNEKIKALEAKREKIEKIFERLDAENEEVDIIFSISIQSKLKNKKKKLEYSA